jgi:sec-independent protein translocase protein TatB
MFDVGWMEMLVVGALALIVVGPRELPQLLRTVGRWVGQVRRMAREFQRSMEDAARETDLANMKELRDLRKDLGSLDFRQQAQRAQSYLKQPVQVEPKAGAKPAQPAAAPDPGDPAPGAVASAPPPAQPPAQPQAQPQPRAQPPAPVAPAADPPPADGAAAKASEG